ncbi:MAG: phosphate ABC transporter substrate-binding protein [Cyanobacteria bacterium J055]|nr:MAG: phosphate ABC transporter substrate-binding protein [Cyanobacteria bacterium J055]
MTRSVFSRSQFNSKTIIKVPILLGLVTSLSACGQSSQKTLVLTGSSTVAPLAAEIAKRYEAEHPGVRIDVQTGGSSRGIADARSQVADIGMVSRSLKSEESDLTANSIARDGITVILHGNNAVKSLTNEQIIGIYTDKINNWQEVGGNDAPITVVNKAEGRSTLELFADYFKLENTAIKADTIIGDNEQGIKTIAGNPNAIGYVSVGAAEYNVEHGTPIKLLPVNGVEASTETVRNGTFPISRPLNLVTSGAPQGLSEEFVKFAQSSQVKDIVEEQYFVPISQ